MSHQSRCPNCGNNFKCQGQRFKHNLSRGLVITLMKMAREADRRGVAAVNVRWDDGILEGSELGNYTKLQYFNGLIVKELKNEDKHTGRWIVTHQAWEFLRGERSVPKYVITQNANVIEESREQVTIKDFERDLYQGARWQKEFLESVREVETKQAAMI